MKTTEKRTDPFYFDHAELSPDPVHVDAPDVYGRRLEKAYDKIFVYTSKTSKPYYIWTQFRNGRALVDRLTKNYKGKWVTAKLKFDGGMTHRISSVGFQIVDEPNKKEKSEEEEKKAQDKFTQLELFDMKLTENTKVTLTISQLKKLIREDVEEDQSKNQSKDQSIELEVTKVSPDDIAAAEQILIDNGAEKNKARTILQAIGYALLDTELYFG